MSTIMNHFPLPSARRSQEVVLKAIEKAFNDGYDNVLLEAPVGSGKSAIAITVAKYYGDAHILTPRKSLQDQYHEDFQREDLKLMKGRGAYPCTYPSVERAVEYAAVLNRLGYHPKTTTNCASAPCIKSEKAYKACVGENVDYPCPYKVAVERAGAASMVVHNLHSFIFQTNLAGWFQKRSVLILDEAHEMEGIIRGFITKKINVPEFLSPDRIPKDLVTIQDWQQFLLGFINLFREDVTDEDTGKSERDLYVERVQFLDLVCEPSKAEFAVKVERDSLYDKTSFEFIPEKVSSPCNSLILNYGQKRLLMSGTIYSKSLFCRNNGLDEEKTCFIRIPSSFPVSNRPIYLRGKYLIDTSHRMWDENFDKMIENTREIFGVFDDVKGLIHAPSYSAMVQLEHALRDTGRVITHNKDNFLVKLREFYDSKSNSVFISPICQQGVDFKYDRAKFQIILRVPYASTSDAFVEKQVRENFPWYNLQALITFGQQIGRVVRAEDDFGATILMDSRFVQFIHRNRSLLPTWLTAAVVR